MGLDEIIADVPKDKIYYNRDDHEVIICADCREILPLLRGNVETIITDPVWPGTKADIPGSDDPIGLFRDLIALLPEADRLVVHLGCDTDPRFLSAIPSSWPFLRVIWLRYANPSYKGRLLMGADVAYGFGKWPPSIPGRRVIGGEYTSTRADKIFMRHDGRHKDKRMNRSDIIDKLPHPCARRYEHVRFLVAQFSENLVVDPLAGSGTTVLAAKNLGRQAIGIEIKEEWCDLAVKRLAQGVLL